MDRFKAEDEELLLRVRYGPWGEHICEQRSADVLYAIYKRLGEVLSALEDLTTSLATQQAVRELKQD